ncbi:hypothetical protein TcWFU_002304 [Taenia crassiceps]|uniref:Uncharacterized protein n=1 Tax=Taenia crassiceps TaxID=6207 RepID=A0ABR4QKG0_9CEST
MTISEGEFGHTVVRKSVKSPEKLAELLKFYQREQRLTLLEKRQLFENVHLLEDRIVSLTQQLNELKKKNNELLRSRTVYKIERGRILRQYQTLHRTGFPTIRIEKDVEPWSTDMINISRIEISTLSKASPNILQLARGPISSAACHTTTRIACCTGKKGGISILHLDKRAVTNTFATPRLQLTSVAFSSDGSRLAISSLAGHILIGTIDQTEDNALSLQFGVTDRQRLQKGALLCLDWHCAGECIATGGLGSFVHIFVPEKSQTVNVLRGHRGGVNCVQFLSNGHLLLSASSDRRVLFWDVRSGREEKRFESHKAPVMGAAFFGDGFAFASCDSDGVVLKWDLRNGSREVQLVGEMLYGHGRNCICCLPEGNCLLTGNTDGSLTLINPVNNEVLSTEAHKAAITAVNFDSQGDQLLTAGEDGIHVGKMMGQLSGPVV